MQGNPVVDDVVDLAGRQVRREQDLHPGRGNNGGRGGVRTRSRPGMGSAEGNLCVHPVKDDVVHLTGRQVRRKQDLCMRVKGSGVKEEKSYGQSGERVKKKKKSQQIYKHLKAPPPRAGPLGARDAAPRGV